MNVVVRYASTADGLEIAYQVLGEGPIDIVIIPGLMSNIDILLQCGGDDLIRAASKSRANYLHSGFTQRIGDDLGAAVMTVEGRAWRPVRGWLHP